MFRIILVSRYVSLPLSLDLFFFLIIFFCYLFTCMDLIFFPFFALNWLMAFIVNVHSHVLYYIICVHFITLNSKNMCLLHVSHLFEFIQPFGSESFDVFVFIVVVSATLSLSSNLLSFSCALFLLYFLFSFRILSSSFRPYHT